MLFRGVIVCYPQTQQFPLPLNLSALPLFPVRLVYVWKSVLVMKTVTRERSAASMGVVTSAPTQYLLQHHLPRRSVSTEGGCTSLGRAFRPEMAATSGEHAVSKSKHHLECCDPSSVEYTSVCTQLSNTVLTTCMVLEWLFPKTLSRQSIVSFSTALALTPGLWPAH